MYLRFCHDLEYLPGTWYLVHTLWGLYSCCVDLDTQMFEAMCSRRCVKEFVRWGNGKRLTDRLPKLRLTTHGPADDATC